MVSLPYINDPNTIIFKREKEPNKRPMAKGGTKEQINYKKVKAVLPVAFQCSRADFNQPCLLTHILKLGHSKYKINLKMYILRKGLL